MKGCQKPSLAQRDHGLVLQAEVVIVSISSSSSSVPIPPGSATNRSADFRHQLLALGKRLDDLERAEVGRGALPGG